MINGNPQPERIGRTPAYVAVTVIVPMRNEEERIGKCLDSIRTNEFDRDQLEILVVDGRSTDRSREVVEERAARCGLIRLLDNPAKIVSSGLNIGIRHARGSVIVIMGAHAEYAPNYIETCVRELEAEQADVVGGILETRPGGTSIVARAIALMSQHRFGVGGSAFRTQQQSGYVDTVPYGAYRREVFERIGMFNEELTRNQDFELNARLHGVGGRLFLSNQIKAAYYNVPNFLRLIRQGFNNGYWLPRMWVASPTTLRMRHGIPALFVATLLVSLLWTPWQAMAALPGFAVLSMYAIAVSLAAGQIAWREGLHFFLPLVAVFFVHHVAYGVGTLAGFLSCAIPSSQIAREASPTANGL